VIAASGLMRKEDINSAIPHFETIITNASDFLGNGGSCKVTPDGSLVIEPVITTEILLTASIDLNKVIKERQNFEPSGHYLRPDVFQLKVHRKRQRLIDLPD
jgi:nitrilase